MVRRERVPAHRVLWFEWGNSEADVTRTQTIFRFSRPDTAVATALRAALEECGVPQQRLQFDERSRAERTRGSHVRLTAKKSRREQG
jgi:hypothetical protein